MPEKTLNDLPRDLRMLYQKGFDAAQRENLDYAIEMFMQVLDKEPTVFDVRKSLRMAQQKKSGAKASIFKRAFNSASSQPMITKARMSLNKNPLEAMKTAEQILNTDANNAGAHKLLAEAAIVAELPQAAVMSLEIVNKNTPGDKETGLKLAEAWALTGNNTRAEQSLVELRKHLPNDNEVFMALKNLSARKTLNEGGYEALADGKGSYRDILKDKAESVRLEQENRQVKAQDTTLELMADWEGRLKAEPNNVKMLRNLAETHAQRNEFDKALVYFDRLAVIDGGNDPALQKQISDVKVRRFTHALAQLDQNAPDYAEQAAQLKAERQAFQLEECRARAEKYPTDLQIRFELGQLYFEAGKLSEAQAEFQKAQNNPHRKLQAMTFLAKCFAARGMNDLAAKRLQEALKEKLAWDDEKKDLVYTLGVVLEKMGKKDEAMDQFKAIYEVSSDYKDVGKRVEDFYSGGGSA